MRILHVIPFLDPAAGGPPMVATRLAAAQAGLGHDVTLFSYHQPASVNRISAMMASLPDPGAIRRINAAPAGRLELFRGAAAGRMLAARTGDFDFLHLHGVWEGMLAKSAAIARRARTPYCVIPHGMLDPWCLRQGALKKKFALALGIRRMLNGAAFIHALNADERDLLAPLGLRAPAEVIPNGVFLQEVDPLPAPGSFRATHRELRADPYILFLSRLHHKKGLDFLADAFGALLREAPDARLVVAGPDDGERPVFEARIAALGVGERVHVTGPLYGRDKIAAYVDAAAFCLPSRQEGFSMAITESMACGTPVVISRECHFPEVEEAGAGLITPLEPAAIASSLLRILRDGGLRQTMSRAARALVESRYTWPRIAEMSLEACGRHAPASPRAARGAVKA